MRFFNLQNVGNSKLPIGTYRSSLCLSPSVSLCLFLYDCLFLSLSLSRLSVNGSQFLTRQRFNFTIFYGDIILFHFIANLCRVLNLITTELQVFSPENGFYLCGDKISLEVMSSQTDINFLYRFLALSIRNQYDNHCYSLNILEHSHSQCRMGLIFKEAIKKKIGIRNLCASNSCGTTHLL